MNTSTHFTAYRDITYLEEAMSELRQILESTPFHCKVLVYPQRSVGLIRIEYEGSSEEEVRRSDHRLTANMIVHSEAKGSGDLFLLPLELL